MSTAHGSRIFVQARTALTGLSRKKRDRDRSRAGISSDRSADLGDPEIVRIVYIDFIPHFFTLIKQNGALLAKGRIAGIQFETLFSEMPGSAASADSASEVAPLLYEAIGQNAIDAADRIRAALVKKGYEISFECPTNQLFITVDDTQKERLEALLELSFWEKLPDGRTVLRICTSWATDSSDVDKLIEIL